MFFGCLLDSFATPFQLRSVFLLQAPFSNNISFIASPTVDSCADIYIVHANHRCCRVISTVSTITTVLSRNTVPRLFLPLNYSSCISTTVRKPETHIHVRGGVRFTEELGGGVRVTELPLITPLQLLLLSLFLFITPLLLWSLFSKFQIDTHALITLGLEYFQIES